MSGECEVMGLWGGMATGVTGMPRLHEACPNLPRQVVLGP